MSGLINGRSELISHLIDQKFQKICINCANLQISNESTCHAGCCFEASGKANILITVEFSYLHFSNQLESSEFQV